jgi:hypothetical protein
VGKTSIPRAVHLALAIGVAEAPRSTLLAATFWNQGRWSEAEQLGVKVMETSKRCSGRTDSNIAVFVSRRTSETLIKPSVSHRLRSSKHFSNGSSRMPNEDHRKQLP